MGIKHHGVVAFALGVMLMGAAWAHDHANPALDGWYKSLTNKNGGSCCDGSDAYSVEDPDWDTTLDPDFPFKVKIGGEWLKVDKDAVVKQTNKAGVAKVWPVEDDGEGSGAYVRCFLPGSGA